MTETKIPKIIHYCWFGGKEMPELEQKCLKTWKKKLKGYTFMLWDEKSFDIDSSPWTKAAYQDKKFAFVADYVRLFALYTYGGIYLDTDIRMVKNFDDLLCQPAFMGFEDGVCLASAVLGTKKGNIFYKSLLDIYDDPNYRYEEHKTANVIMITEKLVEYGLTKNNEEQYVNGIHIYPKTFFNPMDYFGSWDMSRNTRCVHLYSGSWLSQEERKKLMNRKKPLIRMKKYIRGCLRRIYSELTQF